MYETENSEDVSPAKLILILFIAVSFGIYYYLNSGNDNDKDSEEDPEEHPEDDPEEDTEEDPEEEEIVYNRYVRKIFYGDSLGSYSDSGGNMKTKEECQEACTTDSNCQGFMHKNAYIGGTEYHWCSLYDNVKDKDTGYSKHYSIYVNSKFDDLGL